MKVTAYGGLITVSVDGTEYIRYTDASPIDSGYVGFRAYNLTGEVDDLVMEETQSVYYVRGAAGEVLAEYDHAGALAAEYAYGGGQRVAVLKPSGSMKEVSYYFSDHLGSARVLWSGSTSSAKWASDYYAYGEVEAQTGQEGESRFGYTGHESDFATDLIYAGARYYDAETGRWLSVDPLTSKYPAWSPYTYAANNPLVFIDPEGLEWYFYQDGDDDEKKWHYHKDTPSMKVWTGEYDENGEHVLQEQNGLLQLMTFDGFSLSWLKADGSTEHFEADSGVLDENGNIQTDKQDVENVGPIPEEWYYIDPKKVQNWDDLPPEQKVAAYLKRGQWPGGMIAWGAHRVQIQPERRGNRSNFFIHGGWYPGSAGCIDLCGNNDAFFRVFSVHDRRVPLQVRY